MLGKIESAVVVESAVAPFSTLFALAATLATFAVSTSATALAPLAGATAIAAGSNHTCVIAAGGAVQCWGNNSSGQLGTGSTANFPFAVGTTGISGAKALVAGFAHTCAIVGSGDVMCWGANSSGQLGNGAKTNSPSPVTVAGVSGAIALGAGHDHTCAVLGSGEVKCWGDNFYGQLGNGTTVTSPLPVTVVGLGGATAVALGESHTCAIVAGGAMRCWGNNFAGQLGNGTRTPDIMGSNPVPVTVIGISGATALALGQFNTCALLGNRSVSCWGANAYGERGDGSPPSGTSFALQPVPIWGNGAYSQLAALAYRVCATQSDGGVACWGNYGKVGDPSYLSDTSFPTTMSGISGAKAVATGDAHNCAIVGDGAVKCWGYNLQGVLGNGGSSPSWVTTPVSVVTTPAVANYQGLWWNPNESGWGINFAHQGDTIFATWYTYDASGNPWWLVSTLKQSGGVFSGEVSEVHGQAFDSVPWLQSKMSSATVGTMTLTFSSASKGSLAYTVKGVTQTKAIEKEVFGVVPVCIWGAQSDLAQATNYTDLWWNADESGWGINLAHQVEANQVDVIYATWFTYDASGQPWWLVATMKRDATVPIDRYYTGAVSTVVGPPFSTVPWDVSRVKAKTEGRMSAIFFDGNRASISYTVKGISQTKRVSREVFAAPGTVCR